LGKKKEAIEKLKVVLENTTSTHELCLLHSILLNHGAFKAAVAVSERIKHTIIRYRNLKEIAKQQVASKNGIESALDWVSKVTDPVAKIFALCGMFEGLYAPTILENDYGEAELYEKFNIDSLVVTESPQFHQLYKELPFEQLF